MRARLALAVSMALAAVFPLEGWAIKDPVKTKTGWYRASH